MSARVYLEGGASFVIRGDVTITKSTLNNSIVRLESDNVTTGRPMFVRMDSILAVVEETDEDGAA